MPTSLNHVALGCATEDNAGRFYEGVLGLDRLTEKSLDPDTSRSIFGLDREVMLIKYGNREMTLEIFIPGQPSPGRNPFAHVCLQTGDRAAFLTRCRAAGVEISRTMVGRGEVVFITDFDGNRFEIK